MTNQVKLHVGYIGKTREGKRVEIVGCKDNLMFYTSKGVEYYQDGALSVINDTDDDIIGPWTDDKPKPEYETGVWYGWNGGECPVHPETVVDVSHDEGISRNGQAEFFEWNNASYPIYAFRIVTPYVEPEPKLQCWVNVYPSGGISTYQTKEKADAWAKSDRIRCVRMIEADDQ